MGLRATGPWWSLLTEVWFTLIFFFCFLASVFRMVSKTDPTWEVASWRRFSLESLLIIVLHLQPRSDTCCLLRQDMAKPWMWLSNAAQVLQGKDGGSGWSWCTIIDNSTVRVAVCVRCGSPLPQLGVVLT